MTSPPLDELSEPIRAAAGLYDHAQAILRDGDAYQAMVTLGEAIKAFDDLEHPTRSDQLLRARIVTLAGVVYDRSGDYAQARFRYTRAAEILSSVLAADDVELLRQRYNAAEIARVSGDPDTALREFDGVRPLLATRLDDDPAARELLVLLDKNRGQALESGHRYAEAETSYAQALVASEDPDQRLLLRISIGVVRDARGESVDTATLESELATAADRLGADDDFVLAMTLRLARFYPAAEVEARRAAYHRIVDALGTDPPGERRRMQAVALVELTLSHLAAQEREPAVTSLMRLAPVAERVYANDVRAGDTLTRPVDPPWPVASMLAHALVLPSARPEPPDDTEAIAALLRAATGYKRGQAELLLAQYTLALTDADLGSLVDDVRALRAGGAAAGAEDPFDVLQSAQAAAVPESAVLEMFERSTAEQVGAAVPPGAALVEYVRLTGLTWGGGTSEVPARYLAFVLVAGSTAPAWIDLGPPPPIDAAAAALAAAIPGADGRRLRPVGAPVGEWRSAAAALAALVWTPIVPHLHDATSLLVAPDSALCSVPFDVLPDGPNGGPLLTTRTLTSLGTGRDLVRLARRTNLDPAAPLVVAAPDFGLPATTFTPLPGTAVEGVAVATLLEVEAVTGPDARRPVVLAARNAEIIHLATHGYAGGLSEDHRLGTLADCGLALAGANVAGATDSDGVLTGLDVLAMDLAATDLVVLSACDTSLGELDDYEGLQGLARSFLLGGARAVVSSLWRVSDDATAALMQDFYRRVLGECPRGTALADAKRAAYLVHPDRPELWAAFVLTGDADQLVRHRFVWIDSAQIRSHAVDGRDGPVFLDPVGAPAAMAEIRIAGQDDPVRMLTLNMRRSYLGDVEDSLATAWNAFRAEDYDAALDGTAAAISAIDDGARGRAEGRCQRARALALRALCRGRREEFVLARAEGMAAVELLEQLHGWPQQLSYAMDNLGMTEINLGLVEQGRARLGAALALKLATLPLDQEQIDFTRSVIADIEGQLAAHERERDQPGSGRPGRTTPVS